MAVLSTLGVSIFSAGADSHHFLYLANSLVHGSFAVNDLPANYADKVLIGDNIYLPLAPMPGVLLVPFAGLGGFAFDERWLAYLFTAFNALCMVVLLKQLRVSSALHRFLLALFFCGTIYLSSLVIGRSWFLAHIIATTFLFLAIIEVLSRRRAWLIGIWLGLAFLTRSPTIFSIPFFVWMLKREDAAWFDLRWLLAVGFRLGVGLAGPLLFFAYYNYARFGSPLETGYGHAVVGSAVLTNVLKSGLFNLVHVPKNLYALLLAGPQAYPSLLAPVIEFPYLYPSPWGMGLFFTTPAFVYIFAANWRERLVRASWLAVLGVAVPLVTYYGIGWIQFGYRYALDFYPFVFLLVALGIARKFDWRAQVLIVLSIVINVWGAWWQLIGFRMLPVELQR